MLSECNHPLSYRRAYKRFKVEASATLAIGEDLKIPSILADLSVRGGGIFSNYPLCDNAKIDIAINAPALFKDTIYKKANVAWCKKVSDNLWQAGLDFGLDNLLQFTETA